MTTVTRLGDIRKLLLTNFLYEALMYEDFWAILKTSFSKNSCDFLGNFCAKLCYFLFKQVFSLSMTEFFDFMQSMRFYQIYTRSIGFIPNLDV